MTVETFRQWQAREVKRMSAEYADMGYTVADLQECRTKQDYWIDYMLPWLNAGKPVTLPVCRWLYAESKLLWVQKNFPSQVPHVFSASGKAI